jgi:pteridine reductase
VAENLQGSVILVTGGAKRVGASICRALHRAGASIAVHYRQAEREAQALAAEFDAAGPGSAVALGADLLDQTAIEGLVAACVERFGRLDGLVNNASSFHATPLGSIRESDWSDLIGSNLRAPLFLAQAAAPHLRAARGAIVNITDIHAERPLRGYPLYCAAKAGLAGLTRALAVELAPEVRVNAIAPGPILWPEDGAFDAAAQAAIIDHTLLARAGAPQDIAAAAVFLLRDAPYVTGQILAVDGGRSAHL